MSENNAVQKVNTVNDQMLLEASMTDGSEITATIINNIFETDSPEALLSAGAGELDDISQYFNRPMSIQDFRLNRSAFAESVLKVYAVVNAVLLDTNTPIVFGCGAQSLLAQLWHAQQKGWLPLECMAVAKKTASGTDVYKLVEIPKESKK